MALELQLERTGFPVKIGELEFWFDNSVENLAKVFDAQDDLKKKELEITEKIKAYEEVDEASMGSEIANKIIELQKEYVSGYYDVFFGEGSFDKIYKKYPDINQLEDLVPVLDAAIGKEIEKREDEREDRVKDIKEKYLNKKRQKK